MAHRLIDAAVEAGADAVKFQTFRADRLATVAAPKAEYQKQTTGAAEGQLEMLRRLELSDDAHRNLKAHCDERGILFFSSPFDEESADFLAVLGAPAFKVPSGEVTNLPFLMHLAGKGLPLLLSTGMSWLGEVEAAVRAVRENGDPALVLLQCVSNYPADPADTNLRAMDTMAQAFGVLVGYSDHTLGIEVPLAAVARGACVVEKHLTLDCGLPGPDHRASAEPAEFAALVRGIRVVESTLGTGRKEPAASERNTAEVARKSLVAAVALKAGTVLRAESFSAIRPGNGISPALRSLLIGRRLRRDLDAGEPLRLEVLE